MKIFLAPLAVLASMVCAQAESVIERCQLSVYGDDYMTPVALGKVVEQIESSCQTNTNDLWIEIKILKNAFSDNNDDGENRWKHPEGQGLNMIEIPVATLQFGLKYIDDQLRPILPTVINKGNFIRENIVEISAIQLGYSSVKLLELSFKDIIKSYRSLTKRAKEDLKADLSSYSLVPTSYGARSFTLVGNKIYVPVGGVSDLADWVTKEISAKTYPKK